MKIGTNALSLSFIKYVTKNVRSWNVVSTLYVEKKPITHRWLNEIVLEKVAIPVIVRT